MFSQKKKELLCPSMSYLTFETITEDIKEKEYFTDNGSHNILRVFGSLPNFSFAKSETWCDN